MDVDYLFSLYEEQRTRDDGGEALVFARSWRRFQQEPPMLRLSKGHAEYIYTRAERPVSPVHENSRPEAFRLPNKTTANTTPYRLYTGASFPPCIHLQH